MRKSKKVKLSEESDVRETLVENEVISNRLFDDVESDTYSFDDDEDLNDLLRKLDNITSTFKEENENPFYYFLNMYTY